MEESTIMGGASQEKGERENGRGPDDHNASGWRGQLGVAPPLFSG